MQRPTSTQLSSSTSPNWQDTKRVGRHAAHGQPASAASLFDVGINSYQDVLPRIPASGNARAPMSPTSTSFISGSVSVPATPTGSYNRSTMASPNQVPGPAMSSGPASLGAPGGGANPFRKDKKQRQYAAPVFTAVVQPQPISSISSVPDPMRMRNVDMAMSIQDAFALDGVGGANTLPHSSPPYGVSSESEVTNSVRLQSFESRSNPDEYVNSSNQRPSSIGKAFADYERVAINEKLSGEEKRIESMKPEGYKDDRTLFEVMGWGKPAQPSNYEARRAKAQSKLEARERFKSRRSRPEMPVESSFSGSISPACLSPGGSSVGSYSSDRLPLPEKSQVFETGELPSSSHQYSQTKQPEMMYSTSNSITPISSSPVRIDSGTRSTVTGLQQTLSYHEGLSMQGFQDARNVDAACLDAELRNPSSTPPDLLNSPSLKDSGPLKPSFEVHTVVPQQNIEYLENALPETGYELFAGSANLSARKQGSFLTQSVDSQGNKSLLPVKGNAGSAKQDASDVDLVASMSKAPIRSQSSEQERLLPVSAFHFPSVPSSGNDFFDLPSLTEKSIASDNDSSFKAAASQFQPTKTRDPSGTLSYLGPLSVDDNCMWTAEKGQTALPGSSRQSGSGSSGSDSVIGSTSSSFSLLAFQKSSGSGSRVSDISQRMSPYQFVDSSSYPSQSSLNSSQHSSPLDLPSNTSVASSGYDKVNGISSNSVDMSSFDVPDRPSSDLHCGNVLAVVDHVQDPVNQDVIYQSLLEACQESVQETNAPAVTSPLHVYHQQLSSVSSVSSLDTVISSRSWNEQTTKSFAGDRDSNKASASTQAAVPVSQANVSMFDPIQSHVASLQSASANAVACCKGLETRQETGASPVYTSSGPFSPKVMASVPNLVSSPRMYESSITGRAVVSLSDIPRLPSVSMPVFQFTPIPPFAGQVLKTSSSKTTSSSTQPDVSRTQVSPPEDPNVVGVHAGRSRHQESGFSADNWPSTTRTNPMDLSLPYVQQQAPSRTGGFDARDHRSPTGTQPMLNLVSDVFGDRFVSDAGTSRITESIAVNRGPVIMPPDLFSNEIPNRLVSSVNSLHMLTQRPDIELCNQQDAQPRISAPDLTCHEGHNLYGQLEPQAQDMQHARGGDNNLYGQLEHQAQDIQHAHDEGHNLYGQLEHQAQDIQHARDEGHNLYGQLEPQAQDVQHARDEGHNLYGQLEHQAQDMQHAHVLPDQLNSRAANVHGLSDKFLSSSSLLHQSSAVSFESNLQPVNVDKTASFIASTRATLQTRKDTSQQRMPELYADSSLLTQPESPQQQMLSNGNVRRQHEETSVFGLFEEQLGEDVQLKKLSSKDPLSALSERQANAVLKQQPKKASSAAVDFSKSKQNAVKNDTETADFADLSSQGVISAKVLTPPLHRAMKNQILEWEQEHPPLSPRTYVSGQQQQQQRQQQNKQNVQSQFNKSGGQIQGPVPLPSPLTEQNVRALDMEHHKPAQHKLSLTNSVSHVATGGQTMAPYDQASLVSENQLNPGSTQVWPSPVHGYVPQQPSPMAPWISPNMQMSMQTPPLDQQQWSQWNQWNGWQAWPQQYPPYYNAYQGYNGWQQAWQPGWQGYTGYPYSWDAYSYHGSVSVQSSSYDDSRAASVIEQSVKSDDVTNSELNALTSDIPLTRPDHTSTSPVERFTPLFFTVAHIRVGFSASGGIFLVVPPSRPVEGEAASVSNVLLEDFVDCSRMQHFPGPLICGETSKKTTMKIAKMYAEGCSSMTECTVQYREALRMLWEYMVLLLRQNGTADVLDVAELLMSGIKRAGPLIDIPEPMNQIEPFVESEFNEKILAGLKKDALEHACKYGLWAHALMLASAMGPKIYQSVQQRFTQSLSVSSPFVTLLHFLQDPDAKNIRRQAHQDSWREHLAVMVANPTSNIAADREKLVAFGDSLLDKGLVPAAHLCYLLAEEPFGAPEDRSCRLSLLGVNHRSQKARSVHTWAEDAYIHLTEVYQYARSLKNKNFMIPSFQQYKFIYAQRLAEFGYLSEALAYLETVGQAILSSPDPKFFSSQLIWLDMLATRLCIQDSGNVDQDLPDWILGIRKLIDPSHPIAVLNKKHQGRQPTQLNPNSLVVDQGDDRQPPHRLAMDPRTVEGLPVQPPQEALHTQDQAVKKSSRDAFSSKKSSSNSGFIDSRASGHLLSNSVGGLDQMDSSRNLGQLAPPYGHYQTQARVADTFVSPLAGDNTQIDEIKHGYSSAAYNEAEQDVAPQSYDSYLSEQNQVFLAGQQNGAYHAQENGAYQQGHYYDPDLQQQLDVAMSNPRRTEQLPEAVYANGAQYAFPQSYDEESVDGTNYSFHEPRDSSREIARPTLTAEQSAFGPSAKMPFIQHEGVARYSNGQAASEEKEEEEDLFGEFSKKKKKPQDAAESRPGKVDSNVPTSSQSSKVTQLASAGLLDAAAKAVRKIFRRGQEVYLPDDKPGQEAMVYSAEKGKWIHRDGQGDDIKELPPPPPTASMPREPPKLMEPPKPMERPLAQSVQPAKNVKPTLLDQTKMLQNTRKPRDDTKREEENRPKPPPSVFSMKGNQRSLRGSGRYVNVLDGVAKPHVAAPVLDPFPGLPTSAVMFTPSVPADYQSGDVPGDLPE